MSENETSYDDILSRSWDDVQKTAILPVGTWVLKCRGVTFKKRAAADKSDRVIFSYEVREPMDDVDTGAIQELGPDYKFESNRVFYQIWVDTDADWDLKVRAHIERHGVETGGMNFGESFKAVRGAEIAGYLSQETYTNKAGETIPQNVPTAFQTLD